MFQTLVSPNKYEIDDINLVTTNKPSPLIKIGIIFASFGIAVTTIFLHLQYNGTINFPWYAVWLPVMAVTIPCFFHPIGKHFMKEIRIIHRYRDTTISRTKRYFYRGLVIAPFLWFSILIAAIVIRHYLGKKFYLFHVFIPAQLLSLEFLVLAHLDRKLPMSTKHCFKTCSFLLFIFSSLIFLRFQLNDPNRLPWVYVFCPLYIGECSLIFDALSRYYSRTEDKECDSVCFKYAFLPLLAKFILISSSSVFFVFLTLYLEYGYISINDLFVPLYIFEFFIILFLIKMSFSKKRVTPESIN
ncbi:hypothetical protein DICPUDRAFT_159472 [Dictyostelium purpureum]|uniref:Transmembrane protein n=1 Tax=Dictyostelium purpureum TaxID=5786 RepID=F1A477_DICPU|nr:uncharacterized protein DICPUDRAFT_159472 [Dictyostelium purpureum]EGC29001.1 hypothetical protein DICPUDRAFT_159472 [Dictyostelium purpureum]|eukprot:XP_003294471.1 hypothetical protein DICPUDRAFT_159472 [Dictyostelium purpureum]